MSDENKGGRRRDMGGCGGDRDERMAMGGDGGMGTSLADLVFTLRKCPRPIFWFWGI